MAFKMKGPSLYPNYKGNGSGAKGAIPNQKDYAGQADGRATSSPFQAEGRVPQTTDPKNQKTMDDAYKRKNTAINKLMSKHGVSKKQATAEWNRLNKPPVEMSPAKGIMDVLNPFSKKNPIAPQNLLKKIF